jgi:GxxExxY protein
LLHKDKTEKIIQAFFTVYNALGYGFREKVYENALAIELRAMGFEVDQQHEIIVYYRGQEVGEYYADFLVDKLIIVEIKASRYLVEDNEGQLLNYLKATTFEGGLLFNFGIKPEFKRKAYTNDHKGHLNWTKPDK